VTATLATGSARKATGSPAERFSSRNPDDFSDVSARDEFWRFSPVATLRPLLERFTPTGSLTRRVDAPTAVAHNVVPMDHPAIGKATRPTDKASALAFAHSASALLVQIPANAVLDAPVTVAANGSEGSAYAHLTLEFGAFAEATVVLDYRGRVDVLENVEIVVGDGAQVTVLSLQNWDPGAVHLSAHAIRLGRDSSINHVVVNLGGSIVRLSPTVSFTGPGGNARCHGVSFAGAAQHFEARLFVDHSEPDCASDVLYKNALLGDTSRTVWIGDVRIRPAATGTDTYEMNRNLLLSEGARADSVPNLEIETGEIAGAGHASATGRFDDLQLFYLQSRGIDEQEARRLVVRGFFADVIGRIGVPEVEGDIMTAIEERLGYSHEKVEN